MSTLRRQGRAGCRPYGAEVVSERAKQANRRNAKASTGPRTVEGKARSSQNARRHGLSMALQDDSSDEEVERLTRIFAGAECDVPLILGAARGVAEAHVQLRRVQTAKLELMHSNYESALKLDTAGKQSAAMSLSDVLNKLERLDRYERRALSARKTAIRYLLSSSKL